MTFEVVVDFIKKNREYFLKFEEDLEIVTKNNLSIARQHRKLKSADVVSVEVENMPVKPFFPHWIGRNGRIYQFEFKGEKYSKDLGDIFIDFALNHYKTVKSGREFMLSKDPLDNQFKSKTFPTPEDKMIYLASVFSLLYNIDFVRSVESASFEEFVHDRGMFLFAVDKSKMWNILKSKITINNKGVSQFLSTELSLPMLKADSYMHVNQLFANLNKSKKENTLLTDPQIEREKTYQSMLNGNGFEDALPVETRNKLNKLVGENQKSVRAFGVDDDFKIQMILHQMPQKISKAFYDDFTNKILFDKNNKELSFEEIEFIIGYLIVSKYKYETTKKYKYIEKKYVKKLFNFGFEKGMYYKKLNTLDLDFKTEYINKHFQEEYSVEIALLPMLYGFCMVDRMPHEELEVLLDNTRGAFGELVHRIENKKTQREHLLDLYTVENVLNRELFIWVREALNSYCYYVNSAKYISFPDEVKKQIAAEGLKHHVLLKTEYKDTSKTRLGSEKVISFEDSSDITRDIFETFDI